MSGIILNTAQANNSGARIAAGATVKVGIGPTEISEQRAKQMLACGLASESVAKKPVKKLAESK